MTVEVVVAECKALGSEEKTGAVSGEIQTQHFNLLKYKFYVLPTQCIYVFCVDLRTNSDYFPLQH
jgi:hypothetical protein